MKINGKDITFHLNLRATKDIAVLCPNRDLTQVDKLFERNDTADFIDNITNIAVAMSKNRENEEPLTAEDVEELDILQLNELVTELRNQFRADRGTNVKTQPIKKKGAEGKQSSSD